MVIYIVVLAIIPTIIVYFSEEIYMDKITLSCLLVFFPNNMFLFFGIKQSSGH